MNSAQAPVSTIIVAAGGSRRMGFDKLSAELCGKSVLQRSIEAFQASAVVAEIIIVTGRDRFESIDRSQFSKITQIVEGGKERHFSVWNGIQATAPDYPLIAVHDGARPLVSPDAIANCAQIAAEKGAATLAHPVADTLKRSTPGENRAAESVDRTDLWAMETPQIFSREILIEAYETILGANSLVTDEVTAVQAIGRDIEFVQNPTPNFKITVPSDLDLARAWLTLEGEQ